MIQQTTERKRQDLLALVRGERLVCAPPIAVRFEDTGELLYWAPPTPAQLEIPTIVFPYDSREAWLNSPRANDEQELYDRYGKLVLKRG